MLDHWDISTLFDVAAGVGYPRRVAPTAGATELRTTITDRPVMDSASTLEATLWLEAHVEEHTSGHAADLNQYWYSASTIATLADTLREHCLPLRTSTFDCAFLSTPSLFFALTPTERERSRLLEFDATLGEGEANFVQYDYHRPHALPAELKGSFSCVVIDPPFITSDVWLLYVQAAKHLLSPGGRVVCTTVIENAPLLEAELGVRPHRYLPAIPNLPYQYAVYTNFPAAQLDRPNPEVPHDPDLFLSAPCPVAGPPRSAAAEAPLTGAGHAYDFEAMVERARQRQGQGGA